MLHVRNNAKRDESANIEFYEPNIKLSIANIIEFYSENYEE